MKESVKGKLITVAIFIGLVIAMIVGSAIHTGKAMLYF